MLTEEITKYFHAYIESVLLENPVVTTTRDEYIQLIGKRQDTITLLNEKRINNIKKYTEQNIRKTNLLQPLINKENNMFNELIERMKVSQKREYERALKEGIRVYSIDFKKFKIAENG